MIDKSKKKGISFGLMILIGAAVLFAVQLISVAVGSVDIAVSDVLRLTAHKLFGLGDVSDIADSASIIIFSVRLPRVILSSLVGACLAISGCIMQSLLKNPLADGSILGVSSGAALGASLSIMFSFRLDFLNMFSMSFMSMVFAFASLMAVLAIARAIDANLSNNTIILVGVVFSMFVSSIVNLIVSMSGDHLRKIIFWSMGSFSGKGWSFVLMLLPFFIAGALVMLLYSRELNAFSLGESEAKYIGVNVRRVKIILLIAVSMLVGVSVALSGSIAFVGLIIPHMVRRVAGPDHFKLLPLSILGGAAFLTITDLISRTLIRPAELPVGVITSFVGAVLFMLIFLRTRRVR